MAAGADLLDESLLLFSLFAVLESLDFESDLDSSRWISTPTTER